jgi:pyruvate dehydrogenase E2 component (dihydrolipoamide acetyltransferase)
MPIDVLMPQLSPTMTEGRLARWTRNVGDKIAAGDVLAEVETDKATMEVEASEDGIIHALVGEIGADLPVGAPIAVLAKKGETVPAGYVPAGKNAVQKHEQSTSAESSTVIPAQAGIQPASAPAAALSPVQEQITSGGLREAPAPAFAGMTVPPQAPVANSGRIIASPLAKRLAQQRGLNLNGMAGSGPNGRIIAADLARVPNNQPSTINHQRQPDSVVKLTPMRKAIAARLTEAKQTVPHFYLKMRADLNSALALRQQLNAHYEGQGQKTKISVNDLIIKASALALNDYPAANASWAGDSITQYGNVDIAVAVSIEGGLITPIVAQANTKTLAALSHEMKTLAADARAGKLKPAQYTGGSFSISNLGMYGVDEFSAIINPPQAAILAVGAADKQGLLTLTLSVDHRVIDGALGAELLGRIRHYLENPVALVL